MSTRISRVLEVLVLSLAVIFVSTNASAQSPKPGPYYEDKTDLGFKVQVPAGWKFVPPQPHDPNVIGRYVAPNNGGLLTRTKGPWPFEVHLVKFDRRAKANQDDPKVGHIEGAESAKDYVDHNFYHGDDDWKAAGEKKLKVGKLDATEYQFSSKLDTEQKEAIRVYAMVVKLQPDVEFALIGNGPGDDKKWGKFEDALQQMGRSLKTVEIASVASAKPVGSSMRDQKRAKLQDEVTRLPGWKLYETTNYFLVSNSKDEAFMKELMERLEAIRKIYEELYTEKQATELRMKAIAIQGAKTNGGGTEEDESKKKPGEEERPPLTEEDLKASFEASRACVVRVCTDAEMYHSYGGPNGSAGYWSPFHEELVIYDDQKSGGRSNTWKTMNHEAFHQYIFYFYGNISPHSWYNEGSGDFYAGYTYDPKSKQFKLKPFDWRVQEVKDMVRESTFVPLAKFVRYSQPEYYGSNKDNASIGNNYAQGWALIYFLRTAPKKFKGWLPAWNSILPTYLETLVMTSDVKKAVDKAFDGVDIDGAFTDAWKAYLKQEL